MKIQIINGPNLNLLGVREKSIYGDSDFDGYLEKLRGQYATLEIYYYQSNVEGEIINKLHEVGFSIKRWRLYPYFSGYCRCYCRYKHAGD
jgi:3-dehydroquinate dehydratase-2